MIKSWTTIGKQLLAAGCLTLGLQTGLTLPAIAVQFDQREVNQRQFILVAAPYGNGLHQLLILEQLSNRRQCWREYGSNPIMVEPLLLNFDFTGICNRSTDSNGYSLRIGGQDLGLQYGLRLVQQNNDLVLVAYPFRDRTLPTLELGRTNGIPNGFGKIILDPGWRLTQRVYQRRALPHLYLTRDNAPPGITLALSPTPSLSPSQSSPTTSPSQPLPPVQRPVVPPRPRTGSGVLTAPVEIPVPPPANSNRTITTVPLAVPDTQIPIGNSGSGLPSITISATPGHNTSSTVNPSSNLAAALGYNYRLLVYLDQPGVETTVRSLVPDAFRTRVNG
ncbi:MAG: DUF3747 domain-containing protein, partial [Cyanobacteriota bacterium SKYGB_h_bin112]|nr:DUF3747 domain-containing protein [Cyanobacteriota bacterium SKYGB_h_bin112]